MMKKKWLVLLTSAVCALSLAACGDGNNGTGGDDDPNDPGIIQPVEKPATAISLSKTSVTLTVGGNETITATVTPTDSTDEVQWKSGNTNIATVVNGKITAVAAGNTTITATAGQKSATCTVTVNPVPVEPKPATAISLDRTSLTLKLGKSETLVASVTPADSTDEVQWSSSSACVTVNKGVVTAVSVGDAVVTARAGEQTAQCMVTVESDNETEQGYIWTENFAARDSVPGYLKVDAANTGKAEITEDGLSLTTGTQSGKKVFVDYDFESVLDGTVYVQMRIKFDSVTPFNNILFFLTEDGQNAATVAMDNTKYHNNHSGNTTANKWAAMCDFEVKEGVWQDIELFINTETGTLDFYVTDGENTGSVLDQPIRVPANKDSIKKFRIGGDKENIAMTIASIKVKNVTGPTLSLTKPEAGFTLNLNDADCDGTYTLVYSATSSAEIADTLGYTVTCDKTSGFTIGEDKKTLTFTAAGTYTFTVTARDKFGSAFDTVTITVEGNKIAPAIEMVSAENATLSLQDANGAKYKFEYTVTGSPAPTDSVQYDGNLVFLTDAEDGTIKSGTTVTFKAAGTYVFTVEANNGETPTAQKTVTVTVTDKYALPETLNPDKVVYSNDFTLSDGIVVRNSGNTNGKVAYDEGKMHITTNGSNNANYLFDLPFGKTLNGVNSVEMDFSLNSDNINFTNIMFFQPENSADNTTATACFAIEGNKLKTHSGKNDGHNNNWYDVTYAGYSVGLQKNVVYTLRAVLDITNNTTHLYLRGSAINLVQSNEVVAAQTLGGEVYIGAFSFRVHNAGVAILRTGTNRASVEYTIDNVKVYSLTPTLTVTEKQVNLLNAEGNIDYTFKYTADEGATVTITCDDETVGINEGKATFTKSGVYTFTLTAANDCGAISETVTVVYTNKNTSAIHSVDFTDAATRPELPVGTNGNAAAEYTEKGLHMTTDGTKGSIALHHDLDAALTGIVTAEITFSLGENHASFLNLLFLNQVGTTTPVCAFGIAGSGYIQHTPKAASWINQQYNGKDIMLQKGSAYTYTLRVVADFDKGISYLYLLGSNIKLKDTEGEITLPEDGLFIASNAFRGDKTKAQRISTCIDNQANIDYTVSSITVKSNN